MTKFLLAAAAASAVAMAGSAALAAPAQEPLRLDEAQMDGVSAGLLNLNLAIAVPTQVVVPTAVAVSVGGNASAGNIVNAVQVTAIKQWNGWR